MSLTVPAFDLLPATELPITGTEDIFPVGRIFCVGRNYADHVVEMGGDPDREEPFFFTKPANALTQDDVVPYPSHTEDLHHEMELVVAIGPSVAQHGMNISVRDALSHVFGYAAGVDLTRRDLQAEAKKRGRPWDMAKGFDFSCPCSDLRLASDIGHPESGAVKLSVDGELKQDGDLAQQVWKVPEIVANLSTYVTLRPGDLIMTGTPAGVGPLLSGQRVEGEIEGIGQVAFTVAADR
ncbi:fumarylacetoacetate hydrolase family protein [Ahrensia sp. R2A130]|uniref:fumarylacetoacetate hydrolase family protein n=1 Tax=Ahrensia sp. R2A130 TaxID=744979 RepID=UPI0001E0B4B9|nr:fumarylacetoacetate hydrolase family protein [Ahrensia sp. R2A130]EFL89750.1 fumarylacetoacetate hydrolase domain-containing protein 1 [Ahrensia sp. R2A130]